MIDTLRYHVKMVPTGGGAVPEEFVVEGHDVKWGERDVLISRYETDGTETTTFVASASYVRAVFIEPEHEGAGTQGTQPRLLEIVWVNDETMRIELGGAEVTQVNHDEQGWDGMNAAIKTAKNMAKMLGIRMHTEGTPNL